MLVESSPVVRARPTGVVPVDSLVVRKTSATMLWKAFKPTCLYDVLFISCNVQEK